MSLNEQKNKQQVQPLQQQPPLPPQMGLNANLANNQRYVQPNMNMNTNTNNMNRNVINTNNANNQRRPNNNNNNNNQPFNANTAPNTNATYQGSNKKYDNNNKFQQNYKTNTQTKPGVVQTPVNKADPINTNKDQQQAQPQASAATSGPQN